VYHALDMGVSYESFWNMSARAIVLLHREMRRTAQGGHAQPREAEQPGRVRLDYIPRP